MESTVKTYLEDFGFLVEEGDPIELFSEEEPTDEAWRAAWHVLEGKFRFRTRSNHVNHSSIVETQHDDHEVEERAEALLILALKKKASDIHLEPTGNQLDIRFRLDGQLVKQRHVALEHQAHFIAHLKIRSGMDIAEKRRPQDGRIQVKHLGKQIDFRVSTLPTQFGEKMVLRLLDKQDIMIDLEHLGMPLSIQEPLKQAIASPYGLILVTGPTGSGKTTTLYSCLKEIQSESLNIMTVEDPIEYQLEGISQTQVKPEIDVTFATALRTFLRQDPNVIMIGEMRDSETAELGVRASLTGHLVFSTLHTNDTCSSIPRLLDMGIPAPLLSSCLRAVLSQRLVRRLCTECKEPNPQEGLPRMVPRGCDMCYGKGYKGRIGLFEWLPIDETLRSLITKQVPVAELQAYAREKGLPTLRDYGLLTVDKGLTSLAEVLKETSL